MLAGEQQSWGHIREHRQLQGVTMLVQGHKHEHPNIFSSLTARASPYHKPQTMQELQHNCSFSSYLMLMAALMLTWTKLEISLQHNPLS